jgi:hypothetical protein
MPETRYQQLTQMGAEAGWSAANLADAYGVGKVIFNTELLKIRYPDPAEAECWAFGFELGVERFAKEHAGA